MALLEEGWFALLVSLGESAPFVIIGLLIAGLVREFVPAEVLKDRLGGSGLLPILRAVGLGALLPICSCSTIPLGLGMARSGAGSGTALAFMTSAPALSPVTIILGLSLLGPALLGSYSVAVICGSCCIGLLGNKILQSGKGPKIADSKPSGCGCGCEHPEPSKKTRFLGAVRWGLFDLGSEVSLSLFMGLLVATILLIFTPDEWILQLVGQPGPLAILAVILLALPAYTCSVPALLIAGSLIAKGADPGIAIAFLIAGPATNLGELNAIRTGLGLRTAGFYFVAVLLMAIGVACTVQLLPKVTISDPASLAESGHQHHRHIHFGEEVLGKSEAGLSSPTLPIWRLPFVCIIVALAAHQIYTSLFRRQSTEQQPHTPQTDKRHSSSLLPIDSPAKEGWSR